MQFTLPEPHTCHVCLPTDTDIKLRNVSRHITQTA